MTQDSDMGQQAQRKMQGTHPQGAQRGDDAAQDAGLFSALHALGFSVFPLRHQSERENDGSKRPQFGWAKFQQQRCSADEARQWDAAYAGHNAGVVTGAISGIVVLDVDSDEGQAYAETHGLPRTPCVVTGKGRHYYFRHPGMPLGNWARKRGGMQPLPGLDFRGDGGYVLGAGCVHPTGAVYAWDVPPDDCAYADMPQWLLDYCLKQDGAAQQTNAADTDGAQDAQKGTTTGQTQIGAYQGMASATDAYARAYVQSAVDAEVRLLESMAPDSGRNSQLNTAAFNLGQLVGQGGLTQGEVERLLFAACVTNMLVRDDGDASVNNTLRSGLTAGMAKPRSIPPPDEGTGLRIEAPPDPQPLQVNTEGQLVGGEPLSWRPTEVGNAERLVHHHGHLLRYNHTAQQWLVWDGTRWAPDAKGKVRQIGKAVARGIVQEAMQFTDDRYRDLLRWAVTSEKAAGVNNMLSLAQSEPAIAVTQDMMDRNPLVLNLRNGTLDLDAGTFREHRQDDLLTRRAPVAFDPDAQCPTWLAFLHRIFNGDRELMFFLQQAVGYSLTADTSEQCFFLLWGSGQNGKSTLVNTLMHILGDYAQHTKYETVLAKRQDNGVGDDLAMLDGARFVAAMEGTHGRALAESLVKQLTGGDPVTARFLYGRYFTFRPQFKLWLATNHRPIIKGTDLAIWRRVRLVPFTVTIPDDEKDPQLAGKLQAEASGILNWAVAGFDAWREKGLVTPAAVSAATDDYRAEMDALGDWLAERCEVNSRHVEHFGALYKSYCDWCEQNGESPQKNRTFRQAMVERGFTTVRGNRNAVEVRGIQLLNLFSGPPDERPNR